MEDMLRTYIVCELGEMRIFYIWGTFFKELFENIDADTETGVSLNKDSEPKSDATEPKLSRVRK